MKKGVRRDIVSGMKSTMNLFANHLDAVAKLSGAWDEFTKGFRGGIHEVASLEEERMLRCGGLGLCYFKAQVEL